MEEDTMCYEGGNWILDVSSIPILASLQNIWYEVLQFSCLCNAAPASYNFLKLYDNHYADNFPSKYY